MALRIEYIDAAHLLHDWQEHLSRGGTFVRTDQQLPVGAPLRLSLCFPGLRRAIALAGVVRAVRRDGAETGVEVAIQFADEPARERIAALIGRAAQGDPELCSRIVRLLVLDDNPHVTRLISEGLREGARRQLGGRVVFDCVIAKDGVAGLEAMRARRFDAVIADVYLPVMDGTQFIRAVREHAAGAVPILAVSAGGNAAREAALAAGADLFLDKPLRLAELVATMRQLLGL